MFLCNDLLKSNLQEHSVENSWELPVLSLESHINMVKKSGYKLETTEY